MVGIRDPLMTWLSSTIRYIHKYRNPSENITATRANQMIDLLVGDEVIDIDGGLFMADGERRYLDSWIAER